ncbi:MAG TPA: selenocysteine-specific translation elongation factor [Actinomycetota bacterium]|nr:selenocysteine-specific translation elongation factor [Actinomycetota bacterium]
MHVVATAGHVDHGKSTLVQALTGIDPDRLEEEKRRGLTIDLGFAWVTLPSGREVGIVDVPGHERFIKNMLAGVGAITVTLFVVAANEGWKPQSQEHLDILDLLGVRGAVVAVTKADLVEADVLDDVMADIRRRIDATTLAGAPILAVSAVTGRNLDALKAELDRVLAATPPAEDRDRPRLWVDRVFSMKGSGTVVTGTLTGGSVRQDAEVELLPGGLRARVRGIQSHHRKLAEIGPGNRTALNLVGVEPESVQRGDAVSRPGLWRTTRRCLAAIRFLEHLGHEASERGAFKVYLGSSELPATLRFLEEAPEPGGTGLALLTFSEPAVVDWSDHVVLRDSGRSETLGGGTVLEPHPPRASREALAAQARRRRAAGDRAAYFTQVLAEEGVLAVRDVALRTGLDRAGAEAAGGVWLATVVFSEEALAAAGARLADALRSYQAANPKEAGMPRAAARRVIELPSPVPARGFDDLVDELARRGGVVVDAERLRTADFVPALGGSETDELLAFLAEAGAAPPPLTDLGGRFDAALIRGLVRAGQLVAVSPELVYLPASLERIRGLVLEQVAASGPFTVAQFRDLVGASRKWVVPLLEYLDRTGWTVRQGDVRILGPKAAGPAS